MADYMKLISKFFPTTEAICNGDSTVFTNITFISNPKTQAELDANNLELLKKEKNLAIDAKTKHLILSGFTFNSVLFSSSDTAQRNWLALRSFKDVLTYPFGVSAEDDSEYSVQDATEMENLVLTGLMTMESRYASGRALKLQVLNASTEAELNAVVDNR